MYLFGPKSAGKSQFLWSLGSHDVMPGKETKAVEYKTFKVTNNNGKTINIIGSSWWKKILSKMGLTGEVGIDSGGYETMDKKRAETAFKNADCVIYMMDYSEFRKKTLVPKINKSYDEYIVGCIWQLMAWRNEINKPQGQFVIALTHLDEIPNINQDKMKQIENDFEKQLYNYRTNIPITTKLVCIDAREKNDCLMAIQTLFD